MKLIVDSGKWKVAAQNVLRIGSVFLSLLTFNSQFSTLFAQQDDLIALDSLPVVYYSDGVRLATLERYGEALEKFEKVLKTTPDHDPSLFEAANVFAMRGELQRALEYSSRAVALDPDNRWYKGQKARLLLSLEMYDEAQALYEEMIAGQGAFDPENHRMLAILYHTRGRTDDALRVLDSVTTHLGKHPAIVELKRGILTDADRIDEAVAETEHYVSETPYDEENRLVLAELYLYQGRDSLGMGTVKEVLSINPDNAEALTTLADLYLNKGQATLHFATLRQLFMLDEVPIADKIDRFERLADNPSFYRRYFLEMSDLALVLTTHYPGNDDVIELYTEHLIRMGDAEGALSILKTRLDRMDPPPPVETFLQVIEIETWLGRVDSVTMYSDRALNLYPGESQIYMLRSSVEQYLGRTKEARRTLDRALKTAATDSLRSEIYGAIGTLWHEEGNNRKTFAAYEKALKYNSNNALVLNNYAYFLAVENRDLDKALGMAFRAVKLKENDSTYLDTYAWVLYRLGSFAEAKKVMQQALPLDRDGGSPELLIHYGDILYALGDGFMASIYWKRARDAGYEPVGEIEERLTRIK